MTSEKGHFEIVKYLVEKGADKESKNWDNETPLHLASEKGHLEIVKYLVENGACKESNKILTPLHLASKKGHLEIVQYLVENGADKEAKVKWNPTTRDLVLDCCKVSIGNHSQTPLHFASAEGHFKVVKYLVEKGADIETKTEWKISPLYMASAKRHFEIVKYLVEKGADIDSKDNLNQTSLHIASKKGHVEIVKYLVENGANIQAKTNNRQTPLDLAEIEWEKEYMSVFQRECQANIIMLLKECQQKRRFLLFHSSKFAFKQTGKKENASQNPFFK